LCARRPGVWTIFESSLGTVVGTATGAALGDALLLSVWGTVPALIAVLLGSGVGMATSRLAQGRSGERGLCWIGVLCLLVPLLPLPYALVARSVTVRAEHPHRGEIDLASASFDGVRLGADAGAVQRRFGQVPLTNANADPEPLAADRTDDSPSTLDYGAPQDASLRYPYVSFALHRAAVRWIQIDDKRSATAAGIGPGDSIALVRHAYPNAQCAQASTNSEEGPPHVYPYCHLRLGRNRWLTFFGTYSRAGTPITAIWLSTSRLE
jgi:hypothetical protein